MRGVERTIVSITPVRVTTTPASSSRDGSPPVRASMLILGEAPALDGLIDAVPVDPATMGCGDAQRSGIVGQVGSESVRHTESTCSARPRRRPSAPKSAAWSAASTEN